MRLIYAPALLIILLSLTHTTHAKKPDWGGGGGFAVIGFGLVELVPKKNGDNFALTEFTFNYDIPAKYSASIQKGQILILPASSLARYDNIPKSAVLAHSISDAADPNIEFHMSAKIIIDKPGLYIVAYGPHTGLITFDEISGDGRETYKISGTTGDDSSLRWIDQDAGDFSLMNLKEAGIKSDEALVLRIRLLRDKASVLSRQDLFKVETFSLHPKALERVKLLDANW